MKREARALLGVAKALMAAGNLEAYQKLLGQVEKGTPILTAQDIHHDVPTIHNFAHQYHDSVEHLGFGFFEGSTEHGKFSFDAGGAMNHTGDVSWTELRTDNDAVLRDLHYDINRVKRALQGLVRGMTASTRTAAGHWLAKLISPSGQEFWEAYGPMVRERDRATRFLSQKAAGNAALNRFGRSGIAFWESERRHEQLALKQYRDWSYKVEPE